MKKTKKYIAWILVILALSFMMSMSAFSVMATEGDNQGSSAIEQVEDADQDGQELPDGDDQDVDNDEQDEPQQQTEPAQPDYEDDYVYEDEYDIPSETVPEQYYNELPQVASEEVQLATSVPVPDIKVSDTSLIGGVIAWLCLAVGIAVIVGVLVSQRTRQKSVH